MMRLVSICFVALPTATAAAMVGVRNADISSEAGLAISTGGVQEMKISDTGRNTEDGGYEFPSWNAFRRISEKRAAQSFKGPRDVGAEPGTTTRVTRNYFSK
jgi:hypothetical protein